MAGSVQSNTVAVSAGKAQTKAQSTTKLRPKNGSVGSASPLINSQQQTQIRLRLSQVLQTSLELEQILRLFHQELQDIVPVCGIHYQHRDHNVDIAIEKAGIHSCHYRLITNKDDLGEISFSRKQRFNERELITLELIMSSILCPIRNGLLYREAVQTALTDPLTGTGNRIALDNTLQREAALAHRHQQALSILVVDIDLFKGINDQYGHAVGDLVLKNVANLITQASRSTDAVFRIGGEEFVVVLNKTNEFGASRIAERIRSMVADGSTTVGEEKVTTTVSVGVASLEDDGNLKNLFNNADAAMYAAKTRGRNRVTLASRLRENKAARA